MGRVDEGILTVRFTFRGNIIRIRSRRVLEEGRKIYQETSKIQRGVWAP